MKNTIRDLCISRIFGKDARSVRPQKLERIQKYVSFEDGRNEADAQKDTYAKVSIIIFVLLWIITPLPTSAQPGASLKPGKEPISITSDSLSVDQQNATAVFSGNVEAVQGNIRIKSSSMTVQYKGNKKSGENSISHIEAQGKVFFTTLKETAQGDKAVYDVDRKILTVTGNVILTKGQNVVRGNKLVHHIASGKSTLSSEGTQAKEKGGRVQGIFVPENADKILSK